MVQSSYAGAGVKDPPEVLNAFHFCKEFGWTINEFYQQPYVDIQAFSIILSEVSKAQKREMDKAQSKVRRR